MKITFKLNIGNYQSIDFTTNESETILECYEEICTFLFHWNSITDNGKKAYDRMSEILYNANIANIDPTPF